MILIASDREAREFFWWFLLRFSRFSQGWRSFYGRLPILFFWRAHPPASTSPVIGGRRRRRRRRGRGSGAATSLPHSRAAGLAGRELIKRFPKRESQPNQWNRLPIVPDRKPPPNHLPLPSPPHCQSLVRTVPFHSNSPKLWNKMKKYWHWFPCPTWL